MPIIVDAYPNLFQKYNLQNVRTTSDWDDFPYDEITLDEFWNEATYSLGEGYFLSALSGFKTSKYYCSFYIHIKFYLTIK
jgi:hypothetical protein